MPESAPTVQEAVAALEIYQRQLDSISRQIELLQSMMDEIVRARKSLEGLGEEPKSEILISLGASTFVRGTVTDKRIVLSGIGAGYATDRPRDDAIRRLSEREGSLRQEMERMMQAAVQVQQEAARLQEAIDSTSESGSAEA